jgi:hypothetical protein
MYRKMLLGFAFAFGILHLGPVQAQNPGHYGSHQSGVSGSVTIWGGSPYGGGYSGTVNYGYGYPPPPPYAGAYWYPVCNHWHPQVWQPPRNHAYARGYAHGYSDSYYRGGHHGHKKPKHHHGKSRGHH